MINWQPGMTLESIEKDVILMALRFYQDNREHTANSLGISVRTLYNKLKEYGVIDGRLEEETSGTKDDDKKISKAEQGLRVEPTDAVPTQQSLPVRESEKIQALSSKGNASSTAKNGSK